MPSIAPSMLSADFLNLGKDVQMVNANADIFHLDIMDGIFVPNISYGFPVVDAVASMAEKPLDVHLMITDPAKYVRRFSSSGAAMLSFHYEAAGENTGEIVDLVRSCGMKAGVAINPDIPVSVLFPYLPKVDFVLIMSVFAGFGGQKFIPETYGRITAVKAETERLGLDVKIEVDGGVSPSNAAALAAAGADILVAGSAVCKAADPAAVIAAMRGDDV